MKEKITVFLGGTCDSSTWRKELINKIDLNKVEVFNPIVENWSKENQVEEDKHKEEDDICLFVITPEGEGFYSFVEVTDYSNKNPNKTIFCVLYEANGEYFQEHEKKSISKTIDILKSNGIKILNNLDEVANYINNYKK
ncbi:MAG TPA: nucleoside 2-deoxyribosyltransferase domain-containing protein [Bacilli bacterium]|nr:nucleoside 2-deoxyribosyltransferase domain-containing protein [Bacilli bacterium]